MVSTDSNSSIALVAVADFMAAVGSRPAAALVRRGFTHTDAEDAAQEAALRGWLRVRDGRAGRVRDWKKWLLCVGTNMARTALRRKRPGPLLGDVEAPRTHLTSDHEQESLSELMNRLLPEYREMIELLFFEGWSLRAVAARLGVSEPTIRRHRQKAFDELRRWLSTTEF